MPVLPPPADAHGCVVVSTLLGVYDVIVIKYSNTKEDDKKSSSKLQIFIKNTIWVTLFTATNAAGRESDHQYWA